MTNHEAVRAANDAEHARAHKEILRFKTNPESFSDGEREDLLREARKRSSFGAERRWFTKRGKNFRASEHPEVFTPLGSIVGDYGMVKTKLAERSPAQHMAGEDVGGTRTGALIFLENGDVVALRKIVAGDPRLPQEVLAKQEDARRKGYDPDLSADLQYFELQSSATKRQGTMEEGKARLLPASTLHDMIVVPGFPLQFGEDPLTGTAPRTRENVARIFSLDERARGEVQSGSHTARPDRNIDAFRQAAIEALTTGSPAKMGHGALKAANVSYN